MFKTTIKLAGKLSEKAKLFLILFPSRIKFIYYSIYTCYIVDNMVEKAEKLLNKYGNTTRGPMVSNPDYTTNNTI